MASQTDHSAQAEQNTQQTLLEAGQSVASAVRTTLGPNGHDKMLVGKNGKVLVTNDGARILDRIEITDPVGKAVARAARSQQTAVGDGTTTTVLLTGALLSSAESLLADGFHPTTIIDGFQTATEQARDRLPAYATDVDRTDEGLLEAVARTTVTGRWDETNTARFAGLTVSALQAVDFDRSKLGIESVPGGQLRESELVDGILVDLTRSPATIDGWGHSDRRIVNPRVAAVNAEITIEKPDAVESVTLTNSEQAAQFREHERTVREEIVETITEMDVDVLFCQKSIDEPIRNNLFQAGILAVERTHQSQFDAICRATGASAIQSVEQLTPAAVGQAGGVRRRTVGTGELLQIVGCPGETRSSLLLRGGTPHVTEETERIVEECSRNVCLAVRDGRVLPGGGATAVALGADLHSAASGVASRAQLVVDAVGDALETIPRVLATNAGQNPIDTLSTLRSRRAGNEPMVGIDSAGEVREMIAAGVVEPYAVFDRSLAIAGEAATMILRIDDVITTGEPGDSTAEPGASTEHAHAHNQAGPDRGGYPWAISH